VHKIILKNISITTFILYITYTGPDTLFDAMVNGRAWFAFMLDPQLC